jgi:putative transposase
MGRVGSAYDNAMAESAFATLKTELVYRQSWPTRHQLEMEVFFYLEGFYNTRRRHSRLGNPAPPTTRHCTRHETRCPPDGGHFTGFPLRRVTLAPALRR